MPKPPKEKVEKVCENCGATFKTKFPDRAKYCPGSKCRSKAWDKQHRVADPRDVLRAYWRAEWRRNGPTRRARRREQKKDKEASTQ